jgi:hypothetical protein
VSEAVREGRRKKTNGFNCEEISMEPGVRDKDHNQESQKLRVISASLRVRTGFWKEEITL